MSRQTLEEPELIQCLIPAEGMDCPGCAATVTRGLLEVEGVREVQPDIVAQQVRVIYESGASSPEEIRTSLNRLGYGILPQSAPTSVGDAAPTGPPRGALADFLAETPLHVKLGAAFWALTILASLLGDSEAMVLILALATVATAGLSVLPRAWAAARRGILDMHLLMAVAALGALGIGEYVEAGAVLFLFAIARTLEQRTLDRARTEVRSLMDLAPVEATALRHGHQVAVPVDAVREGEVVLVRPGERIPVDGTILSGASEVDASAVTGESHPEGRFPGDSVYAGSVNGSGALEVRCDLPASDSALRWILRSIEEARARKSSTEAFVDRFARIYTPLVMAVALGVALLPPLLGGDWAEWGYRALVLVVIACPCALVISTPVTVVSALTGAARRGILIKSGIHLETMGKVKVVALDKTGTLTEGVAQIARILPWSETSEDELLRMAAAAESRSEHPIGRAVIEEVARRGLLPPEGVEMTALPGRGVRARHGSIEILLGSPRLFREEGLIDPAAEERIREEEGRGGTLVLVGWGTLQGESVRLRGALALVDRVRPEGAALLRELREAGVERLVLLSGDREASVAATAAEAAREGGRFDEWRGELLPSEKVDLVHELQARHGAVLMVGDGVNDAPALAAADVGIAMGSRGTAVALDTADVALMEDDLAKIPTAFRMGRKAAGIIRANVAFALAVKVVFVLLGGAGHATLWMAVVADMGSSLAVILNGLRTLRE